ncbi:uncharacterized protein LOC129984478 [Argiope bruennichi]|uniref:Relaxin receptor 1 like protein n=1 Tax=Argiope bruennichi TaxID=94029 RepID=A0A8T0EI46_ARGBR|nr:uncharacterized protein LOC129984478 [Argiope bruennichi]XP_055950340.1 uncharacterized protein LOC129984478 [Argiope bruennichi]XP_055950341.1 uncharacterized protein LOC129984478 [Argiope bruennichi]KAF8773577.1 Relaxin receptor 1 like protein [Argiope bruennichi]
MLISFIFLSALAATSCNAEYDDNSTFLEERQIPNDNPCNCYFKDSCGCICSRPISWAQFQILPQNFQPCRSFTLALRGGQFHSFPADYFYRVGHVKDFVLDVSRVNFQYLNDPDGESSPYNGVTFDVSAYLRMHEVSVSRGWNWGAFYWLAPTTRSAYCEIQVVQSTVPVLTSDFGRICQGVVTVANIISSGLYAIEDRSFAPFTKLTELDLSGNRIQEMRRSFFSYPARELQIINLSYNNIRNLPPDMFTEMPSLQSINLRGNPISNVDERTFRPIFRTVEIIGLESESPLPFNTTDQ